MRGKVFPLISLIAAVALFLVFAALCVLPRRLAFDGGETYTFYTGTSSSNCAIVTSDRDSAPLVRLTLDDVRGESVTYSELNIPDFLQRVQGTILFEEKLSDSVNYYCSADLPYSTQLYGKSINLHISVREEGVTVASPIIFGGY